MKRSIFFILVLALVCGSAVAQQSVIVAFWSGGDVYFAQRAVSGQPTPAAAIEALLAGPTSQEAAAGIATAIPAGTRLLSLTPIEGGALVDLSAEAALDLDESSSEMIWKQVMHTLAQFGMSGNARVFIEGKPISSYLAPPSEAKYASPAYPSRPVVGAVGLSGKRVTLSPGHGYIWTGSAWGTQRSPNCSGTAEDFHNLKMCRYLNAYFEGDGAYVQPVREFNASRGNGPSGHPWWQDAAYAWLKDAGYSCSVFASSSGVCTSYTGTVSRSNDDIRSRPLASNLDSRGNTDIFVSIHTNGFQGNCDGSSCPSGTDVFYNNDTEHATWAAASINLADDINSQVISAIQTSGEKRADGQTYNCHGSCSPKYGNFGEIRIPQRPAALLEVGYHDSCDTDSPKLEEPFFQSVAMWGVYKGVCDYFGNTPTWAMYSSQYVSDDIPAYVTQGETRAVHITFRNKGVLWQNAKGFHLGAVGDSDPFAATRHDVTVDTGPGDTVTFTFNMTFTGSGNQVTDWRMVRDGYSWFGETLTKTVFVNVIPDDQPPSTPQNLRATEVMQSTISLAWDPSTDNVGVAGYRIWRNGAVVATPTTASYTDVGLMSNTTYDYQVDAYDFVPIYSSKSNLLRVTTIGGGFSDGFNGGINGWILDTLYSGNLPFVYSTAQNHGTLPGAGSAYGTGGAPHYMHRWLDNSTQSLTQGGFKTGRFEGWIYDVSPTYNMRSGIRVCGYDSIGALRVSYYIGVTTVNPPNLPTQYLGGIVMAPSTYYDLGPRSAGWHRLMIEILPYTGSNDVKFYLDGVLKCTASQPAIAAGVKFRRVYIGFPYDVYTNHYYDDLSFTTSIPAAPSDLSGAGLSENSVRWSFTDNANNEIGDRIYDGDSRLAQREEFDATYVDETGLTANTRYTRTVRAYAGDLESADSASASACTLSVPPSASNVICDRPAGAWQSASTFTFTAVGGFGAGTLDHYEYTWDQQPAHTWTGAEPTWVAGAIELEATASVSPWYLHVRGFNLCGIANGSLDLGPYYFAPEVSIFGAKALADGGVVRVAGQVVSAAFDGSFYVQETSRTAAVKVVSGIAVGIGQMVDVVGTVRSEAGERYIEAVDVTVL